MSIIFNNILIFYEIFCFSISFPLSFFSTFFFLLLMVSATSERKKKMEKKEREKRKGKEFICVSLHHSLMSRVSYHLD